MTDTAYISKISHASLEDGKGIRTVVFFAGCGLKCKWCHNPESISLKPVLMYLKSRCILCGRCAEICPAVLIADNCGIRIDRSKCNACGECTRVCYSEALSISQREMKIEDVFEEIANDKIYYKYSGGGVTFSGGECLRQPEFLKKLLLMCAADGINTCIETCLDIPWDIVEDISEYTDAFFVDIKLFDSEKHRKYTGVGNERILSNIRRLFEIHKDITFRIPLIPEVNDDMDNLERTVRFVSQLEGRSEKRIELLKYNNLAQSKYESIGQTFNSFGVVQSESSMEKKREYLNSIFHDVTIF